MIGAAPTRSDAFVEVEGVSHYYDYDADRGSIHAIDDVDLRIGPSEFVSVVGPSGCGKSTLMLLVAGLMRPIDGRIVIDGAAVTKPYSGLGLMFQTDLLLDWRTVRDNVMLQADVRRMDRHEARRHAADLLERVGLDGFENRWPWELSGGMRQRVAICRTLLHHPRLLLMDEPFSALDALTRETMIRLLQRMWLEERPAVMFVTHDIEEAVFLSDRVIIMSARPGRIVEEVPVNLPRPRDTKTREDPAFWEATTHILRYFESADAEAEVGEHVQLAKVVGGDA